MRNRIIVVVSIVLLLIVVGYIIIITNSNNDKEPTDNELDNQYSVQESTESTALHINDVINNSGGISADVNLKFIKDLGHTPENKIYAFKTAESNGEDVSDLYADYIENQTGQRPYIYWIESVTDGELIYWYASDGTLQSILY